MNLGALIKHLKYANHDAVVVFDFCGACPNGRVHSYRGYYEQLAIGWADAGYYGDSNAVTVSELVAALEAAVGATFEGWKGGNCKMSEHTEVWVDNPGDASGTRIVAVRDMDHSVVLMTAREDI